MDKFSKKVKDIFEGHYNNVSGENEELGEQRMAICKECPKHHNNFCIKKRGGCGCYLPAKTKVLDQSCPDRKW